MGKTAPKSALELIDSKLSQQPDGSEEWMLALYQFFDESPRHRSSPGPLANLMRSGKPMPKGVLHFLADLIDPPQDWKSSHPGVRLLLDVSPKRKAMVALHDSLDHEIALAMLRMRNAEVKHEEARERVAEQFGKSTRWVEKVYAEYIKKGMIPAEAIQHRRRSSAAPKSVESEVSEGPVLRRKVVLKQRTNPKK